MKFACMHCGMIINQDASDEWRRLIFPSKCAVGHYGCHVWEMQVDA